MKKLSIIISLTILFGIILSSCASPTEEPLETVVIPVTATEENPATESVTDVTEEPSIDPSPTLAEMEETAETMTEETGAITHQNIPGEPIYTQSLPGECNTGFNYGNPGFTVKAPCDSWSINLLERPVSDDLAVFYHYLDILSAKAGVNETWLFFRIDLFGAGNPDGDLPVTYYIELDSDQDGQGNFLLSVTNQDLYETAWSVAGVQVYEDQNQDVGGSTPIRPDAEGGGDGYETQLFDAGQGEDPDLAWVRRDPNHVNQIEFAVKSTLLGQKNFMWWAGAAQGIINAQSFDLVDNFTEDGLYSIDTTCGWVMGTETTYNIRKCYIAPNPTPTHTVSNNPTPPEDVCVQPPHPDPQNNCWIWFEDQCEWVCVN